MDLNERDIFLLNQHGEGLNHSDLPRISVETHDTTALVVPGQEFDFDFENRLVHDDDDDDEVFDVSDLSEKNKEQTSKEKRAQFRHLKKKRRAKKLLEKISSGESSDYTYENYVALEGVKNEYPAIVVSSVVDGEESSDRLVSSSSLDVHDDELMVDGFRKKRKRPKTRKFSIASALTDISFGGQSSSSKVSSPSTLLDVDLEADEDLRDTLGDFLQHRRESKRRHRRRGSVRSSDSGVTESGSHSATDIMDMYSGRQNDKEKIFENIKLQKEIMASLRTQPWPMKKKLKTLQLTKSYIEKYEGQLSRGAGYQEASAKYWKRVKRVFVNLITTLIPWEMRIKLIESYFGSVVASYFTFLRWMFWINIIMFILSMSFIVVPDIIFGAPYGSTPERSIPENEKQRALNFETIMDFGGYLQHSILFYGYYQNDKLIGGIYRLPMAYFLVGLSHYGASFLFILRKMTGNSKMSKLTSKDEQYTFSWRIFASWDFMIGNAETAKNKVAETTTVLRESIEEEKERTKKKITKTLFFLRVLANTLVLIVLASSTYAIYLVVERSQATEKKIERGEDVGWWDQNEVSFVMSLITALFPNIFDVIGLMEKYHPRINLRFQLGRILVLYLLNLYTLMFALYWKIVDKQEAAAVDALANCTISGTTIMPETVTNIQGDLVTLLSNCTGNSGRRVDRVVCWETMLGREISKLVFFDLIMTVATILVIDFVRGIGVRYLSRYWFWDLEQKFPEYGEFKIAENLLHAIYNQATVWMGVFFSPLLPGLNIVKLVIMLYVRSWAVIVCNIPHERVFKASRSNNFYFALLLLMLFLVTLPIAFLLVQLQPSPDCGPFKGLDHSYHALTNTLQEELPDIVNNVLGYIASPGIVMPALLLLVMAIYYLLSINGSLKESNEDLRNQILRERNEEREKVSKIAEATRSGKTDIDGGAGPTMPEKEPLLPTTKAEEVITVEEEGGGVNEEENEIVPVRKMRILRVPGMSMDQANFLKTKFPGLKVLSREDAVKQNLIPPPPPPPPEPDTDDQDEEAEIRIEMGDNHTSEEDSPYEPEIHVDATSTPRTETEVIQVERTRPHIDPIQISTTQLESSQPVTPPASDLLTSPLASGRALRSRTTGSGSTPPIAVVQGKPSKRFQFDEKNNAGGGTSAEDAALF